jgi:predicted lipoprotein with Yx(FWY)xxD motif
MRRVRGGAVICGALVALAACSSGGGSSQPTAPVNAAGPVALAVGGANGQPAILVDGTGAAVYVNRTEAGGQSECDKDCLRVWPLVLVAPGQQPRAGERVSAHLVSTIPVAAGRAVTYAGYPLHTYVGDVGGAVSGEGIGGLWSTVTPSGKPTTG